VTRLRTLLIVAGVGCLTYAVLGLFADPDVRLGGVLLFLVAVLVVHDALWMPLVLAVGALVARVARPARMALLTGAAVAVVGVPLVLSPGRPADNPSVLPLHYGRNLAIVLAGVAAVALAAVARNRQKAVARNRQKAVARNRKKSESRRPGRSDPADR
jgi:hypothetical protein